MFLTDGYNIKIPRGDTADISFTFTRADSGEPYRFTSGQYAELRVFPVRGAEAVISASASAQDAQGAVTFHLSETDTDIPASVYLYTLRLTGAGTDTWLGFPEDAFFAVGSDCAPSNGYTADVSVNVSVGQGSAPSPAADSAFTAAAAGSDITVSDCADARIPALKIYGTGSGGTASPLIVSVLGAESVSSVQFTSGAMLRGAAVDSDGTYTDGTGQSYIADELDTEKGVVITRIASDGVSVLDVPVITELSDTEKSACRTLRTVEGTSRITNNSGAFMEIRYIRGSNDGITVAQIQDELQSRINEQSALTGELQSALALQQAQIGGKQSALTMSGLLTLTAAGWDSTTKQQTVAFAHDTTCRNVIDITPAEIPTWAESCVYAVSETSAGITFKCSTVPSSALTFRVTSMEVSGT